MKVALYLRVSSEKQEEEGTIESQRADLHEFVNSEGHIIIDSYVDDGYSGTLLARPELDRLRDDAAKSLFEAVVIHSPDRLARNYVYQEIVIEELARRNVQIIFKNRRIAETPEDKLLLGVQGIISEYERAKLIERTRRGKLHRAKSGNILGNIPPYGYHLVKKHDSETGLPYYLINKDEAKIVQLIFKWITKDGYTLYKIVQKLNDGAFKPRKGQSWMRSSVSKIIHNETYTGSTYYNKHYGVPSEKQLNGTQKYYRRKNASIRTRPKEEWIKINNIPALIDLDTFNQAQKALLLNSQFSKRNEKRFYLLKGLMKCGIDNRMYYGIPMHGRPFYRCYGKSKLLATPTCPSRIISANVIEPIVWETVVGLINDPTLIKNQLQKRFNSTSNLASIEVEISGIQKQLLKLKQEDDRLVEVYTKQLISIEQFEQQNKRIKSEIGELEKKVIILKMQQNTTRNKLTHEDIETYIGKFRAVLTELNNEKKRFIVRKLLKEVVIEGKQVRIQGILPIPNTQQDQLSPQHPSERFTGCGQNYALQSICFHYSSYD